MRPANTVWIALVCALALTAPAAAEFQNGQSSQFGTISLPAYMPGRGPVAVEARIHLADVAGLPGDGHLLLGFNTLDSQAHGRLDGVFGADGTALAVEKSSGGPDAPRLAIATSALTGPDLVLRGTAWSDANGRFHIGALALAFTGDWGTVVTPDGQPAQLYGFTWLGARQLTGVAGPFSGQGNDGAALVPAFALIGLCGFLWWLSRRPVRARRVRPARGFAHARAGPKILTAPPIVAAPPRARPSMPLMSRPQRRPSPGEHPVRPVMRHAALPSSNVAPFPNPMPRPHPAPAPTPPDTEPEPDPEPRDPVPFGMRRNAVRPRVTATPGRPAPAPSLRSGAPARPYRGVRPQALPTRPARPGR